MDPAGGTVILPDAGRSAAPARYIGARCRPWCDWAQRGAGSQWRYVEDRAGLAPASWLLPTVPAAMVAVSFRLSDRRPLLGAVLNVVGLAWLLAGSVSLYAAWVVGLRLGHGQLVVGGCRRADRRRTRGRDPDTVMLNSGYGFRHLFRFPLQDVEEFEVVCGTRLRYRRRQPPKLTPDGRRPARTAFCLPFMRQALYVRLHRSGPSADVTALPLSPWNNFLDLQRDRSVRYRVLIAPTRRPQQLRAAMYAALRDAGLDPETLDAGRAHHQG